MKWLALLLLLTACNQGVQQIQGPQGLPGANGSTVTMVQFCPSYNTSYPSIFPEFGMCINDILYATYWDGKNAWTAEVVPGYYESTSTSAPCNFTVSANCVITN